MLVFILVIVVQYLIFRNNYVVDIECRQVENQASSKLCEINESPLHLIPKNKEPY